MEFVGILVLAAGIFAWWWWNKRKPAPPEDEWVLPPESQVPIQHLRAKPDAAPRETVERPDFVGRANAEQASSGADSGPPRIILDRDSLVNRDRTFDPRNWDNSPDGAPFSSPAGDVEPPDDDLPTHFDREYLEQQAREREAKRDGDASV